MKLFRFGFPAPTNRNVAVSARMNLVTPGDDLTLSCLPEDTTLNVWWTAMDHSNKRIIIHRDEDRIMVSETPS